MSGFPAQHCRVVAVAVAGDDAYVVIDAGSDGFRYLYGGTAQRGEDGWRGGTSGNGDGWIATDAEGETGVLALWDEAPAGCDAVRVRWRDEVREEVVSEGAYLAAWFKVPFPEDSWPAATSFRINGRWVP